jgi:hypothetical protein
MRSLSEVEAKEYVAIRTHPGWSAPKLAGALAAGPCIVAALDKESAVRAARRCNLSRPACRALNTAGARRQASRLDKLKSTVDRQKSELQVPSPLSRAYP